MNPKILQQRRVLPWIAIVCLVVAVTLFGYGLYCHVPELPIFAALPGALGMFLFADSGQKFYAELTASEFVLADSNLVVLFSQINHLWTKDSRKNGPVYIYHERGMFRIPILHEISNSELYASLRSSVKPSEPPIDHRVSGYFQSQIQQFGPSKVWAYVQRPKFQSREPSRLRAVGWALIVAAIVWFIGGISVDAIWLFCCAIGMFVIGPVMISNARAEANASLAKHHNACLVVSPIGIALAQGDLIGELRWDEVRAAKLVLPSSQSRRRICLLVDGAQVDVLDLYDQPLNDIFKQIEDYWQAG